MRFLTALLVAAWGLLTACTTGVSTSATSVPAHAPHADARSYTLPGYIRGSKDSHTDRVIVFIHGVFGDGTSTWTNPGNQAYFPQLIRDDKTFDGVDIWVHEFDTPKLRRSYTIDELADHLRKYLNNDNVIANHRQVIFVCHSLGGLVARAYLLKYRDLTADRVPMIYFFSTPTTGSDLANIGRLISGNPQLSDMRKMTTDDPNVLGIWEAQWASSNFAKETLSYCAYELLPTHGFYVVQRESARHLCNTRPDPIDRNHIDIAKPANNTSDESYIAFREAYRDTFERPRNLTNTPAVWNLTSKDTALLRVRNVTQTPYCENTCWSERVIVAPGDELAFSISYRNAGYIPARDTRLRLDIPEAPLLYYPIRATLSTGNTQPIFGSIEFESVSPVLLVPVRAWLYSDDSTNEGDVPNQQRARHVTSTDGMRLGDISPSDEQQHIGITFRAEPATLLVMDAEKTGEMAMSLFKQLRTETPTDALITNALAMRPSGHIDTGDIGEHAWWVSELRDIHDQSALLAWLTHYNNTATTLRHVRAQCMITHETLAGARIRITLRSDAGELRTASADITYRAGTTASLVLANASYMPKNLIKLLRQLPEVTHDDYEYGSVATSAPSELELGDLPPQTSLAIALEYEMQPRDEHRAFEQHVTIAPAALNVGADHTALQIASFPDTDWGNRLDNFREGSQVNLLYRIENSGTTRARDVQVKLALTMDERSGTARATITAANATMVTGEATLIFGRPSPRVRLYYDSAYLYRDQSEEARARIVDASGITDRGMTIGDLDPNEVVWLTLNYMSSMPNVSTSIDPCVTQVMKAGEPVHLYFTLDNARRLPRRNARLRLGVQYAPAEVLINVTTSVEGEQSKTSTIRALTTEPNVLLRYRDARLYTTATPLAFDAHEAVGKGVAIGTVPAGDQFFLHLIYDVVQVK